MAESESNFLQRGWNAMADAIIGTAVSAVTQPYVPFLAALVGAGVAYVQDFPWWLAVMMGCLAFGAVAVGANQWEMLVERRNPEHKLVAVAAVYQKVVPESKEARPYRLGIAFQNQAPFPMMFEVTSIESSLGNVTIDGPTRASLRKLNQRAFLAPGQGITRWDGAIDTATLGEAAGGTISVTVNYGRRGKRRTYILTKSYTIYLGWTEAQLPFEWYHNDD